MDVAIAHGKNTRMLDRFQCVFRQSFENVFLIEYAIMFIAWNKTRAYKKNDYKITRPSFYVLHFHCSSILLIAINFSNHLTALILSEFFIRFFFSHSRRNVIVAINSSISFINGVCKFAVTINHQL